MVVEDSPRWGPNSRSGFGRKGNTDVGKKAKACRKDRAKTRQLGGGTNKRGKGIAGSSGVSGREENELAPKGGQGGFFGVAGTGGAMRTLGAQVKQGGSRLTRR